MKFDSVIIGAGAAGLFCAIEAGKRGRKVLVLEKSKSVAEKIRISGGGRCNFTNIHCSPANFLSQNPHFCKSALGRYTAADFIKLVESHDITYHEKTLGQLFCDGSSKQIIQMLLKECDAVNVVIQTEVNVTDISKEAEEFKVSVETGESFTSSSLVVATGGPSIPKMGATGFGYDIAKQFGLNVIDPRPALVPFTLNEKMLEKLKSLSGVSVEGAASCNKTTFKEGVLFTHRGLSGPAILQISSYWREGDALELNLAANQNVLTSLKEQKEETPKQSVVKIISNILPKRLAEYICDEHGFEGNLAELSNQQLEKVAASINAWNIVPNGTEGYRTAEVTLGGVDTKELSSKTFESQKVPGLYFIGEVVDVTGHLGGFNFQWAWSSGWACGQHL